MNRWLRIRGNRAVGGLFLVVVALMLAGCGLFSRTRIENKKVYGELKDAEGAFQKTLVAAPFDTKVPWAQADLKGLFLEDLKTAVTRESGKVRILLPGGAGYPEQFNALPKTEDGAVDGHSLSVMGRAAGVNLVMTGSLAGVRYIPIDKGMLWWAKTLHMARFQMEYTIYHTGTGAKLLDRTVFHDVEIPESEGPLLKDQKMPPSIVLPTVLADISLNVSETICGILKYIPWEGYVSTVDGDKFTLPFGESCGLQAGDTLNVYSPDTTVAGMSGQYQSPGEKIGKARISQVYADRADAVVTDGGPVLQNSIVRAR